MNGYYLMIDLTECIGKGVLLGCLLYGCMPVKAVFRGHERLAAAAVMLQYFCFYIALSYNSSFRKMFYQKADMPASSRLSNIPLAVSIALTLLFCSVIYAGNKVRMIYLVFLFYTVRDLIMFMLNAGFMAILNGIVAGLTHMVVTGNEWFVRNGIATLDAIVILWNISFQLTLMLLMGLVFRYTRRSLPQEEGTVTNVRQLFLMVPVIMGFGLVVLLRSIYYESGETKIVLLSEAHPETNVLIPLVAGLCILCILLSIYLFHRLTEYHEKEMLVEIYQSRISDMEEHIRDVEHLYDGIRGMRHDMKNYVADLEVLLQDTAAEPEVRQREMNRYLDGICSALDELEMRCNTGNLVTDVVISRKMRMAKEEGLSFETDFIFPSQMGISAFDVSIILNNGLDNALEASRREEGGSIRLGSYVRENIFFIEIRNKFTGSVPSYGSGGALKSSKEEAGHGFGMKNIKSCADKYYGRAQWNVKNGEFILEVMLQGRR